MIIHCLLIWEQRIGTLYAFSCLLVVHIFLHTTILNLISLFSSVPKDCVLSVFLSLLGEAVWQVSDLDTEYPSVRGRGKRREELKQEASPQKQVDRTMYTWPFFFYFIWEGGRHWLLHHCNWPSVFLIVISNRYK